jgi:CubicO group peptidase (beta-lactamase class C family)
VLDQPKLTPAPLPDLNDGVHHPRAYRVKDLYQHTSGIGFFWRSARDLIDEIALPLDALTDYLIWFGAALARMVFGALAS